MANLEGSGRRQVIVMEPFFDQYISNIQMAGGNVVYVPLHPPKKGATEVCPASEWRLNLDELRAKVTDKTRMIVCFFPSFSGYFHISQH